MSLHTRGKTIFRQTKRIVYCSFFVVFVVVNSGCSILTIDTMKNEYLADGAQPQETRASENVSYDDLSKGIFVGVAMSGGGSRAGNFSAAVLLELEKLGLLEHVTAISSVSGSSLTAAYYGLYGNDTKRWNAPEVRKRLLTDFEARWLGRWFLPHNAARYWTSNFTRSDIMEQVLDNNLFGGKTFSAMSNGGPRILINATSLTTGRRYVFSDETFDAMKSRLDTFPVSNAVMASSAFPGAFHDVTLKDYHISPQGHYEHLFDGGPSDNLGVNTLLDMARGLYQTKPGEKTPDGCMLFVVDAYNFQEIPEHVLDADTRSFFDFFVDTNIMAASDALLSSRREDVLKEVKIGVNEIDINPYKDFSFKISPEKEDSPEAACKVWHISFQRLASPDFAYEAKLSSLAYEYAEDVRRIAGVVNGIPTRYKLAGKDPTTGKKLCPEILQDYIFKATSMLMLDDRGRLNENGKPEKNLIIEDVCKWFAAKGINCRNIPGH